MCEQILLSAAAAAAGCVPCCLFHVACHALSNIGGGLRGSCVATSWFEKALNSGLIGIGRDRQIE